MFSDFKSDGFMYLIVLAVIIFVCVQSLFFMKKAWARGKELGITTDKLKNAVTSSAIFSFAPAIGIAITVINDIIALDNDSIDYEENSGLLKIRVLKDTEINNKLLDNLVDLLSE